MPVKGFFYILRLYFVFSDQKPYDRGILCSISGFVQKQRNKKREHSAFQVQNAPIFSPDAKINCGAAKWPRLLFSFFIMTAPDMHG